MLAKRATSAPQYERRVVGYLDEWEAGCDIAFEGSPDGNLYNQGSEYSAADCYDLARFDASLADVPYEIPYDPYGEGEALGQTDGSSLRSTNCRRTLS